VPLAGVLSIVGGFSILLGYRAKVGAWLIVLFLIPVTVLMHKFWGIAWVRHRRRQIRSSCAGVQSDWNLSR
jgi:uncharacterized membrane protein YphA (DoxX/SURF4 family)